MPARVVDIAGVPVAFVASDSERSEILSSLAAGFSEITGPERVTLAADATTAEPPLGPPRSEMFGIRFWQTDGGIVVAARTMVITVDGSIARAHLAELADAPLLEGCGYLPLAWMLAPHGRFVVHSAAVQRAGGALLLLGNSGAGKSTLAVAALDSGWQVLSDDLTIVERGEESAAHLPSARVHGLHKPPAVPMEIGGRHVEDATLLGDPRDRVGLSRALLTPGGFPITGVVLITHSDAPGGSLRALQSHEVLPLLLQSFAGSIDPQRRAAYFPTAVALSRLPRWELGHARDPALRRARAAHHLDAISRDLGASNGDPKT